MKPLRIDFAPPRRPSRNLRWLPGGIALLLAVAAAIYGHWSFRGDAEIPRLSASVPSQTAEAARAADASIRNLNLPWLLALDVLENIFDSPADGSLVSMEADAEKMRFRVNGEARDQGLVQSIPARLKRMPQVTDAILLGQEPQQGASPHSVLFSFEFRLREPS